MASTFKAGVSMRSKAPSALFESANMTKHAVVFLSRIASAVRPASPRNSPSTLTMCDWSPGVKMALMRSLLVPRGMRWTKSLHKSFSSISIAGGSISCVGSV